MIINHPHHHLCTFHNMSTSTSSLLPQNNVLCVPRLIIIPTWRHTRRSVSHHVLAEQRCSLRTKRHRSHHLRGTERGSHLHLRGEEERYQFILPSFLLSILSLSSPFPRLVAALGELAETVASSQPGSSRPTAFVGSAMRLPGPSLEQQESPSSAGQPLTTRSEPSLPPALQPLPSSPVHHHRHFEIDRFALCSCWDNCCRHSSDRRAMRSGEEHLKKRLIDLILLILHCPSCTLISSPATPPNSNRPPGA